MRICQNLLRVIFLLSTIVAVTDCCSSRILLLRQHTPKMVPEYGEFPQQLQEASQQQRELSAAGIDAEIEDYNETSTMMLPLSTYTPSASTHDEPQEHDVGARVNTTLLQEKPAPASVRISNNTAVNFTMTAIMPPPPPTGSVRRNSSEATAREQHAGNPKYNVIDIYYTIMRDVLSFECSGQYLTDFCLNGGRCFRYPVGNHSFFSCECADGYVGERCESKSLNGLYLPAAAAALTAKKPQIRTARIVFSFPMLIALSTIYLIFGAILVFKCPNKHRSAGLSAG